MRMLTYLLPFYMMEDTGREEKGNAADRSFDLSACHESEVVATEVFKSNHTPVSEPHNDVASYKYSGWWEILCVDTLKTSLSVLIRQSLPIAHISGNRKELVVPWYAICV